jgi:hypothetical protein
MVPVLAFMSFGSAFATLMVCLLGLTLYGGLFVFWLRTRAGWAAGLLVAGAVVAIFLVVLGLRQARSKPPDGGAASKRSDGDSAS